VLDEIVARTKADLPSLLAREASVMARAEAAGLTRAFRAALSDPGLSVIAEVKRRSPSRGTIDADLDPVDQAKRYARGGAAAVSVLTERHYFSGSPADLTAVHDAISRPVLRKDFIVHPLQIWEARGIGADAVLLIVAVLSDADLAHLLSVARQAELEALVEAHDEHEAVRAESAGAGIIGVNNRDLATFDVDLATAERVAESLASSTVKVAESGIWTAADAGRMRDAGYDAVLVGEALVRAEDPAALVAAMRGT